ncbi:16S rRNA (cytidine(1402)-2'-O)-methyltransferase [Pseudoruegeria sp. SHC-113]|uniref:16S rRNA (cytidine(1402)-2'-O)-methyltransferase n=1 Tax=Pseudoruegeria sp. SHC-113 TaxID=2855439 RepID=UPI0021BB298C|nr:16S rRNA (cytidine(1402)-2'-O)-methyltransferase [Pseudoruegeria sp. SHC-113]MCT8161225.1 16S rRNA (cytidine(1402)-2'-O)-methyltransferase [Pseudoruegeria sp. SHC-113]
MNYQIRPLPAGLYFVATPIGSARDITLRALDVLASADVIAAEDTRTLRKLLDIHGVPLGERPVIAYHDHNGDAARPRLMRALAEGKSVAYASEAGTPLVADPGYSLSREALEAGHLVTSAPGPSAAITALTIAGLPTDHFYFAGFQPNSSGARRAALEACADVQATLVFYESPKRLAASLADMAQVLGGGRQAAVCRELTKKFEEVRRASLAELADHYAASGAKGEVVVLVDRAGEAAMEEADVETALRRALETLSVKDAAAMVAEAYGLKRRDVYQQALSLSR